MLRRHKKYVSFTSRALRFQLTDRSFYFRVFDGYGLMLRWYKSDKELLYSFRNRVAKRALYFKNWYVQYLIPESRYVKDKI